MSVLGLKGHTALTTHLVPDVVAGVSGQELHGCPVATEQRPASHGQAAWSETSVPLSEADQAMHADLRT